MACTSLTRGTDTDAQDAPRRGNVVVDLRDLPLAAQGRLAQRLVALRQRSGTVAGDR
jgi:hypothetical protein